MLGPALIAVINHVALPVLKIMVYGGLIMNLHAITGEAGFMVSGGDQLLECMPATSEQDSGERVPAARRGPDDDDEDDDEDEEEEDRGRSNEQRRPSDPLRTGSQP
jgi:hypothetical protein